MKKPYQIEAQRAVKQLEAMAANGNAAVQMMPMAAVAPAMTWTSAGSSVTPLRRPIRSTMARTSSGSPCTGA